MLAPLAACDCGSAPIAQVDMPPGTTGAPIALCELTDPPEGYVDPCPEATGVPEALCCSPAEGEFQCNVPTGGTCDPGFRCDPTVAPELAIDCTVTCTCIELPPLSPGWNASHIDSTVADGTLVVSGYNPGRPDLAGTFGPHRYGDLVIGTYDDSADAMTWEIVDGLPEDGTPTGAPSGWRGGIAVAGPNVGTYSSITSNGTTLYVSYVDEDEGSLKVATRIDGAWTTEVVDDTADHVRWTTIALDNMGRPVVSYMAVMNGRVDTDDMGVHVPVAPTSHIRLRHADIDENGAITAWNAPTTDREEAGELAANDAIACQTGLCGDQDGVACLVTGECALETDDCDPGCSALASEVCSNAVCTQEKVAADYLDAGGLWLDLVNVPTGVPNEGLALVWYDRSASAFYGSRYTDADGLWSAPFFIAGRDGGNPGADLGFSVDLFVTTDGVWHISHVDGIDEGLAYTTVAVDGTVTTVQVDDGRSGDGRPENRDEAGRHIVGDESAIVVTDAGEVRIAYADSTANVQLFATLPAGGGEWAIQLLDDQNTQNGVFNVQELVGTDVSWVGGSWRNTATEANDSTFTSDVRVFAIEGAGDGGGDGM